MTSGLGTSQKSRGTDREWAKLEAEEDTNTHHPQLPGLREVTQQKGSRASSRDEGSVPSTLSFSGLGNGLKSLDNNTGPGQVAKSRALPVLWAFLPVAQHPGHSHLRACYTQEQSSRCPQPGWPLEQTASLCSWQQIMACKPMPQRLNFTSQQNP